MKQKLKLWKNREINNPEVKLFYADYWCSDGDGISLYIETDETGFTLNCFSGIPASKIWIDEVDFSSIWKFNAKYTEEMYDYTFEQRCILIADYFCNLFCEYKDVSNMTEEKENEIINDIIWKEYPERTQGGQTCGKIVYGVTLIHETLDIRITVACERSQLKNKEIALKLFKQFLKIIE